MKACDICLSVLLHYILDSKLWFCPCSCKWQDSISFLWLSGIPGCVCTTFSLCIHWCMDTQVLLSSWRSWKELQSSREYRCLFDRLISFPLNVYTQQWDCGSYDSSVFSFWRISIPYSTMIVCKGTLPSTSSSTLSYLFFILITANLTRLGWYLIVVWICISLIISDVEHFLIYMLALCMSSFEKCLFKNKRYC